MISCRVLTVLTTTMNQCPATLTSNTTSSVLRKRHFIDKAFLSCKLVKNKTPIFASAARIILNICHLSPYKNYIEFAAIAKYMTKLYWILSTFLSGGCSLGSRFESGYWDVHPGGVINYSWQFGRAPEDTTTFGSAFCLSPRVMVRRLPGFPSRLNSSRARQVWLRSKSQNVQLCIINPQPGRHGSLPRPPAVRGNIF